MAALPTRLGTIIQMDPINHFSETGMNNWISVSESLPDLNQMVLVCYPSASDGKPIYAWGARCEDPEGWAWATGGRYGIRLDKDAFIRHRSDICLSLGA